MKGGLTSTTGSYTALIFDIGDVLFTWSAETTTSLSPKTLKGILSTPVWHDFERGRVSDLKCYAEVAGKLSLKPQEIKQAFEEARSSLRSNSRLIEIIKELKNQYNLSVFAMSNISLPDYQYLRQKPADWAIFDDVYISAEAGERKPDLKYFHYVLSQTGLDPRHTVFIDDNLDNVITARSLGMHGIVFDDNAHVIQALRNLIGDPVKRAQAYLARNAGTLASVTNTGVAVAENFAQLLILHATGNKSLTNIVDSPRLFNFFQGKGQLTTEDFPCDLDTTSIGCMTMNDDVSSIHSIMDEMLAYRNADGIIQVYFDHSRPRIDPVVCVNVLSLFYTHGRGSDLLETMDWVLAVLKNRAYVDGTRYYVSADAFLYFFARLLAQSDALYRQYSTVLAQRLQERIGANSDPLALAMRISACASVGIYDGEDLKQLLALQESDGSWDGGWFYKYGSSKVLIGNKGLTTAFAISAIRSVK